MGRQLLLLALALGLGTALGLLLGAKTFGTALGIGQVCFAGVLVYVLLRDRSSSSAT